VSWVLDGRVGSAIIRDRRRFGIAWTRNRETNRVQFIALPRAASIDPLAVKPPRIEKFTIPDSSFIPAVEDQPAC
jgi:hypothetical protein